jgi:hypothetical protein
MLIRESIAERHSGRVSHVRQQFWHHLIVSEHCKRRVQAVRQTASHRLWRLGARHLDLVVNVSKTVVAQPFGHHKSIRPQQCQLRRSTKPKESAASTDTAAKPKMMQPLVKTSAQLRSTSHCSYGVTPTADPQKVTAEKPLTHAASFLKWHRFHGLWGRSSVGRAPQWHCGGRRFDPCRLHHFGGIQIRKPRMSCFWGPVLGPSIDRGNPRHRKVCYLADPPKSIQWLRCIAQDRRFPWSRFTSSLPASSPPPSLPVN